MSATTEHGHHGGHGPARPYSRLWLILQPEKRDIFIVLIFSIAAAILSLAGPIGVESLVNTVAFGVLMWPVVVISIVLMGCLAFAAAIRAMKIYVIECLQRRLFVRVVADYAERLPKVKLESFDHQYGPELANRFFDILNVQKSLAVLLIDGISILVTTVVGMVVLAFYHPFLLGFDVILIFLICFLLFVLGKGGIRTSLEESHTKYDVAGWLEEIVRLPRALKFGQAERLALMKADQLATAYVEARSAHFSVVWRQTIFALGLQVIASTVLLGLGGWLVINRQLTLGQLVASELIVSAVVASIAKLGKFAETYYDLLAGVEKLGILTDLPLEKSGGEDLPSKEGGMLIRLIGQMPESNAPRDVFTLQPGERVAFVGPQGSGLTTFLESLCGLRELERGVVEIDGIDIRCLAKHSLRQRVALVEEDEIFIGTIDENVRMGREDLSPAEVREALKIVDLQDVIRSLPEGIETRLNADGWPLSRSQSLRLTLARAIVGKPRFLALDGILDSLNLSENDPLLLYLFDKTANWTLLLATGKPEILALCDRQLDTREFLQ